MDASWTRQGNLPHQARLRPSTSRLEGLRQSDSSSESPLDDSDQCWWLDHILYILLRRLSHVRVDALCVEVLIPT